MKRVPRFWSEKVRKTDRRAERLTHGGDKRHKQKIKENEGYHGVGAD